MPRSMGHPDYRYSPWTPERRKAASEAAKARHAARRAYEQAQYEAERRAVQPIQDLIGRVNVKLAAHRASMEAARLRFFADKQAIEEMEAARDQLFKAREALRKHLPKEDLA